MSTRATIAILVALGLGWLTVSQCVLVVSEYEQVVLTAFGEPVGEPRTEPGIYLMLPWYKQNTFSRRLLRWDGEPTQVPTKDKRFIWVDITARWRITDPLKFLQSVRSYTGAQTRLDDIVDSVARQTISENNLIEIVRSQPGALALPEGVTDTGPAEEELFVRSGRRVLQRHMIERARRLTKAEYGIDIVDVRVKRINYIDEVEANIFKRMIAERQKVAEQYRSEGAGRAAEILGRMERQLKEIRSGAYRQAREIQGQADAEAARIYAEAYSRDADFYSFTQTLDTWRSSLARNRKKGAATHVILGTDSEFFQYLDRSAQTSAPAPTAQP